uniref:Uncharacterized protein n=1 Tax=Timema shepardi TaxID=629360 RepID=A0A7R9G1M2_TIMSH|nr:unnamed protein product [Timema shepardi]
MVVEWKTIKDKATPDRDLNPDIPANGSLAYCECSPTGASRGEFLPPGILTCIQMGDRPLVRRDQSTQEKSWEQPCDDTSPRNSTHQWTGLGEIDIIHRRESLQDDYTLMDVAYIYTWKRNKENRTTIRRPVRVVLAYQVGCPGYEGHELPTTA